MFSCVGVCACSFYFLNYLQCCYFIAYVFVFSLWAVVSANGLLSYGTLNIRALLILYCLCSVK